VESERRRRSVNREKRLLEGGLDVVELATAVEAKRKWKQTLMMAAAQRAVV
jgi:hypothetical protein